MAKSTKRDEEQDEAVVMERMKQGLKRLLNTPPETHKEMVARRRGDGKDARRSRRSNKA